MIYILILTLVLIILVQAINMEQQRDIFNSTIDVLNDQKRKLLDDMDEAAEQFNKGKKWKK
ncbi:hypothetical protein KAR91_02420 [Candidatus Pacearchaeota archaeon]|nr:hypothetical protein [Candidatus Pacearchaeota archaeon]